MNYTTLSCVINSSPQDTVINDSCHLSRLIISAHPIMNQTNNNNNNCNENNNNSSSSSSSNSSNSNNSNTVMNAFLMKYNNNHHHNRSTIDHLICKDLKSGVNKSENYENCEKSENVSEKFNSEIVKHINFEEKSDQITDYNNKIQLNFSVDRLLNMKDDNEHKNDDNHYHHHDHDHDQQLNKELLLLENVCDDNKISECHYCQISKDNLTSSINGTSTPFSMDFKTIIRPTPVRMITGNNHVNNVLSHVVASSVTSFPDIPRFLRYQLPIPSVTNNFKTLSNGTRQILLKSSNLTENSTNNLARGNSQANNSSSSISGKRKRSWSRAVFSNLQRKGLEIQFQQQKYITKPDRRKLAARLNLTDAQVKVWFQNRRMKWRHTRENLKSGQEKTTEVTAKQPNHSSSSEDEIDVVTE